MKKSKLSTTTDNHKSPDLPNESYTQELLKSLENESTQMTQLSNCVKELKSDENVVCVINNPVTCSQYIQMNHDDPPEVFDDTLNELFYLAQPEESLVAEEIVPETRNGQALDDLQAALNEDCDIFEQLDEDIFKENKSNTNSPSKQVKLNNSISKQKSASKRRSLRPTMRPVSSTGFRELGPFFGLTKRHKEFILKTKNIEMLYDWQAECLNLRAIYERSNLIYALPTSGGKTLVAEIAMFRELILGKRNVIFVLPYVSIVQEKVQDLMPFAVEFNFLIEEYCAGKGAIPPIKRLRKNSIFVCTIEKSQILFDSLYESKRLNEIGLIVVDELHMVGDAHRGFSLETLLAKVNFQQQSRIQMIGMSATIANLSDIARFLKADVYTRDFRPVELTEFVKIGTEIMTIDPKANFLSEAFQFSRTVGEDYKAPMLKRDPDHIAALVLEVIPRSSCLVFCATKQNCENVASLLCDIVPKELRDFRKNEKENLIECIKSDSNGRICPVLAKTIPFGIAYHHSGLTNDERKHLEDAYRLNIICVICCTSTLAAGVNLPAKRVIIRSPYIGSSFLTLTRYKQMVGRAGRAGKCDTGESILICDPRDHQKLTHLLCSKMDETISGFVQDESEKLLRAVVLNLLGTGLAHSIDDLVEFFKCTLLSVQAHRTDSNLRAKMVKSVKTLIDEHALTFVTVTNGDRYESFRVKICGEDVPVYPDDLIEVRKIGKAAVNAGIGLEEAQKIEEDLLKVHNNFVLAQCLHLLYVVAPDEQIGSINPDYSNYNCMLMKMEASVSQTAKIIGITESLAMRMITKPGSIKDHEKLMLKRFYVALMLFELWNAKDIHEVSTKYKVSRGIVYNLLNAASSKAYSIFKFCELYEEFWLFKEMIEKFSKRLSYCCSSELLPLMELPAVKIVSTCKQFICSKL